MTRGRDIRLGRVFVMALHQAISEELPTRVDFYEHWLSPDRMRGAGLGLAPLAAVLGFLRTEGDAYDRVVTRAGTLAAEWAWEARSAWRRSWVTRLPLSLRVRVLSRWVREFIADTCPTTEATIVVVKGECGVEIAGSVFCGAREKPVAPLCGFYPALMIALFACAGVPASGRMEACRAGADKSADKLNEGVKCSGRISVSP